jgi:hypothetical protein
MGKKETEEIEEIFPAKLCFQIGQMGPWIPGSPPPGGWGVRVKVLERVHRIFPLQSIRSWVMGPRHSM